MLEAKLGRTGLFVNKDGFGALPLQRADMRTAVAILQRALDSGIDYFDTARAYTDSEEKIGKAIAYRRSSFILATKTGAKTPDAFWKDLETSLTLLKTDHIDVYQFHNPDYCPKPDDGTGMYEAMLEARQQGKIRFIGITNHRRHIAKEAAESELYDILQYPINYLSTPEEVELTQLCMQKNVGFIAMKALSGGLLTDLALSRSWLAMLVNVVPIWGIQRENELTGLVKAITGSIIPEEEMKKRIEKDRAELSGEFCRACGYCLPCPAGIEIFSCARMSLMLRRSVPALWLTPEWQEKMSKINNCIGCGHCKAHCPYGLDTPNLLKKNYEGYKTFL
ncbi:aldo/keto reductase [Deferribacterales bacterium]|nr:aldo/keto reductase [Deferribacterales bacterium]